MPETKKIVLIGAGGLGIPAAWGVIEGIISLGNKANFELVVVDPDEIELSNLNRQVFYGENEIGKNKAAILTDKLNQFFPSAKKHLLISPAATAIDNTSIHKLLQGANLVIECSDCSMTKFLINDFCMANKIAFCYAGVVSMHGMLMFCPPEGACLRCLFGDISDSELLGTNNSCRTGGIIGAAAGMLGMMQAEYSLRYINSLISKKDPLEQSFLLKMNLDLDFDQSQILPDPICPNGCGVKIDKNLDLRNTPCPQNFLYTKIALEQIGRNRFLDVRLSSQEHAESVSKNIEEEGNFVFSPLKEISKDQWRIIFKSKC
jgi:molybdopterin/thiamine biosynthesis adenylyltransferase/TusA-related sulfurtransferase